MLYRLDLQHVKTILLCKLHQQMLLPLSKRFPWLFRRPWWRPSAAHNEYGEQQGKWPCTDCLNYKFCQRVVRRYCHHNVIPIFFGGRLIALEKKSGGIRPIAIGHTLRRIATKCAKNFALTVLDNKLLPDQLGLGCSGGCEAAVGLHATRRFISNMPADFIIEKLDFSNAINSPRKDVMLSAVAKNTPDIYRYCQIVFDKPTHLKFFGYTILLLEGAQQCDPLGPLLFCLSIHSLVLSCNSHWRLLIWTI